MDVFNSIHSEWNFATAPLWQLQIYSQSIESAISNISLCRPSFSFNSVPSIVLFCQACQRADLLLSCLIYCNDSVYKELEKPPTYTALIFTLQASEQQHTESINGNKTVACLFQRRTNSHLSWSVDRLPGSRKQLVCLDAAHKSGGFPLIIPMTKLPINHRAVCV